MQMMIPIMQGHQSHPSAAGPTSDLRFLAACTDRVERKRGTLNTRNEGNGKRAEEKARGRWEGKLDKFFSYRH
jgi:hypothetical protein